MYNYWHENMCHINTRHHKHNIYFFTSMHLDYTESIFHKTVMNIWSVLK